MCRGGLRGLHCCRSNKFSLEIPSGVSGSQFLIQVVSQYNPTTEKIYYASVNACLAPLVSVDGKHVITVEGVGSSSDPHPVQERIAKFHGSQCGFCTPGIVMV